MLMEFPTINTSSGVTECQHPILYQNEGQSVTLIDIPTSIAYAQHMDRRLLSIAPRSEPYPSTEPKSAKARANVLARHTSSANDDFYASLATESLEEIRTSYGGGWTIPRFVIDDANEQRVFTDRLDAYSGRLFNAIIAKRDIKVRIIAAGASTDASLMQSSTSDSENSGDAYFNERNATVNMFLMEKLSQTSDVSEINSNYFFVPPNSSFILSDCNDNAGFHRSLQGLANESGTRPCFDFILLDPPWGNLSAKRRAAYETTSVEGMILDMDLSRLLQPSGLVGVWITNKAASRDFVLRSGGLFDSLGIHLEEEWIWLKTTSNGVPVTAINGIWRKPYEVLLLGRAGAVLPNGASRTSTIRRRVIVAAPDFHSRKPCLKAIVEPLLPPRYQALEIFARYLVAGWTSWGNEVLKFNHCSYFESDGVDMRVQGATG